MNRAMKVIKNIRLDKVRKIDSFVKQKNHHYFWRPEKKYFFGLLTRKEGIYTRGMHGTRYCGKSKKNCVVIDDTLYYKPHLDVSTGDDWDTFFFDSVERMNRAMKYIKDNSKYKWYENIAEKNN